MPLNDTLLNALAALVGADRLLTQPEDLIPYGFDGTAALKARPGAVVFPLTTAEVSACVRLASDAGVPMVTRGSGTGLSGGSVPAPDALVICLAQMDRILDVDPDNLTMRAQSGVVTMTIDAAASATACSTRPIPARCASARSAATSRRTRAACAGSSTA